MSVSGANQKQLVLAAGTVVKYASVTPTNATTWYEAIASTSVPIYITHLQVYNYVTETAEIGIGAAGSEVVVFSFSASTAMGGNTLSTYIEFPYPIRVNAGVRVALRHTTGSYTTTMGIIYVNESAVV